MLKFSFQKLAQDAKEVAKFNSLAPNHWKPNGPSAILQRMNQVRVPFIKHQLDLSYNFYKNPRPFEGINFLDIGCGAGLLSEPIARLGANILSVDASKEMIDVAKIRQGNMLHDEDVQAIEYTEATTEDLIDLGLDGKFDVVVASEVIEHVPSPTQFLKEISMLLRPGGHCFVSTIANSL